MSEYVGPASLVAERTPGVWSGALSSRREGARLVGTTVLWALVGLLSMVEVLLLLLVLQLLKQHGRLLLRVEQLERQPMPAVDASAQAPLPAGLPVGAPVEPFRLASLDGETVSLENFHGRRVLLVNWHPACGYCDQIAGELAALAPKLRERGTELVLASSGGADENRKLAADHGLRVPILLQRDQPISAFQGLGTPVAYLLDEAGRVAQPLAFGALEVPELARAVAAARKRLPSERPLAESRIERDGLKAGTPAPGFALPSLDGPRCPLRTSVATACCSSSRRRTAHPASSSPLSWPASLAITPTVYPY
jgi:peroxiredoxin